MDNLFTIAQISKLIGLACHTIRFYERQFPLLLNVERTPGGHRLYRKCHLEALTKIIHLLKNENLSIRDAQIRLGEISESPVMQPAKTSGDNNLSQTLGLVLHKLNELCERNERMDILLGDFIREKSESRKEELLDQISKYRNETREALMTFQSLRPKDKYLKEDPTVDGSGVPIS